MRRPLGDNSVVKATAHLADGLTLRRRCRLCETADDAGSNDTLLRVVRRRPKLPPLRLNVISIDDRTWRRNHRYGTIACDLERRRIAALLPDREIATVDAWLTDNQDINVVSRDRGGGYGGTASKALPHAVQVADRCHLMKNASAAQRPNFSWAGVSAAGCGVYQSR